MQEWLIPVAGLPSAISGDAVSAAPPPQQYQAAPPGTRTREHRSDPRSSHSTGFSPQGSLNRIGSESPLSQPVLRCMRRSQLSQNRSPVARSRALSPLSTTSIRITARWEVHPDPAGGLGVFLDHQCLAGHRHSLETRVGRCASGRRSVQFQAIVGSGLSPPGFNNFAQQGLPILAASPALAAGAVLAAGLAALTTAHLGVGHPAGEGRLG